MRIPSPERHRVIRSTALASLLLLLATARADTNPPAPSNPSPCSRPGEPFKRSAISEDDPEFQRNYVDNNIDHVLYWDTPYADQDTKLHQFTVVYTDGRAAQFSLDKIPVRYPINSTPGRHETRIAFKPLSYTCKENGLIYPDVIGFGSTPRLIDVATTIEENHRRRRQLLEVAQLTFKFTIVLSAYAAPPETAGTNPRRPAIRTRGPEVEASPSVERPGERPVVPAPREPTRTRGPGNQEASAQAAAARESEAKPPAAEEPPGARRQAVINTAERQYPDIVDPRTGRPIPFPEGPLARVPKAGRVPWGAAERGEFIAEWYRRGYKAPAGGWAEYDIHHIKPREFGGTNAFENLVPVKRQLHQELFNTFWRDFFGTSP